ncbi:hypothetical protein TNCV_2017961 [Trichonephila clavipes]|nr:hypothetical protein TNCV_2017961 [Trichonephila clavipes]
MCRSEGKEAALSFTQNTRGSVIPSGVFVLQNMRIGACKKKYSIWYARYLSNISTSLLAFLFTLVSFDGTATKTSLDFFATNFPDALQRAEITDTLRRNNAFLRHILILVLHARSPRHVTVGLRFVHSCKRIAQQASAFVCFLRTEKQLRNETTQLGNLKRSKAIKKPISRMCTSLRFAHKHEIHASACSCDSSNGLPLECL